MKKLFTLISVLLFFFFVEGQPKKPLKLEIFQQNGDQSLEFSSNRFSAISISKDGVVWAGTIYEGLYRYDTKATNNKTWKKSTVATDLFINDIKGDPNGGIWVAQSGSRLPSGQNIQGGVNHIPDARRDSVVFYSVSGTQTDGYFYSRNLVSLFISDSNRTFPTSKPESIIFAAQGLSRSGGEVVRGGLNRSVGSDLSRSFERIAGRAFTAFEGLSYEASGWDWRRLTPTSSQQLSRPYAECVGGSSTGEMWVGVRDNYGMTEIVRYSPDGKPKGREASYNHTNSPLSEFSQPRAIKIDRYTNKWITTRNDGIIVLGSGGWVQVKFPTVLPTGTVFNRNAIAEDKWGNMYFGTSAGLVVYKTEAYNLNSFGIGSENSYDVYTTLDGLPGNNITGLAYDSIQGKLLIAVDGGGIAFLNIKPDNIEGVVANVYTGILNKETNTTTDFKKIPISDAKISLFEGGVLKEIVEPDNKGYFKFTKDEPGKIYKVEAEYVDRDLMKYTYSNIESQSKVPPILFPDSLIRELKIFKDSILQRCFENKILNFIPYRSCFNGFYSQNYNDPFPGFFYPSEIIKDHNKKVDNLGIYLANLKTVYDLGGNGTELVVQGMDNGWSMMKSIKSLIDLKSGLEDLDTPEKVGVFENDDILNSMIDAIILTIKALHNAYKEALTFASVLLSPVDEIQPLIQVMTGSLSAAFETAVDLMEKSRTLKKFVGGDVTKVADVITDALDLVSKVVTTEVGGVFYERLYARNIHQQFVTETSAASIQAKSDLTYRSANFALVAQNGESLLSKGTESLEFYKTLVDGLNRVAKGAEQASAATALFQALVIVPGGQPVAAAAVIFAKAAKGVEIGAYAGALVSDCLGAYRQIDLSKKIKNKSGINGLEASYAERKEKGSIRRDPPPPSQKQPVKLLETKNNYNEKITAIQAIAGASSFTLENYAKRLDELMTADSLYVIESGNIFDRLIASADSAMLHIPAFEGNFKYMMDSFVTRLPSYKYALLLNQFALLSDVDNKADYFPALDSTAKQLKVLNDSIYNNYVRMIDLINEYGIEAPAYLTLTDYVLDHTYDPGTPGVFTNTYTNFGTEVMRKVSFKINAPTEGFGITSADSIFVGDIAPGASIQVSFNFNSPPHTDSITIGRYTIDIKAENGKYRNTSGNLMIIKQSVLPVTLINFEVKCSGSNTELSWETTSESNSSHFEIEKSNNGVDWIVVRRIATAGNSQVRRLYKLTDQASENSFYRLKQVDKDGKFTYSQVLRRKCSVDRPLISVYPVPAKDVVNVVTIATKATIAKVVLMDIAGREVRRLDAALQPGENTIRINTSDLSSGHYILRVEGTEINKTVKITINR